MTAITIAVLITLFSGSVFAEKNISNDPVSIIFESDMCIDADDPMALAILHSLQGRGEIKLLAVTVSIDEAWCAPYVDALNTFYGRPDIPIGTIRNGLSLAAATKQLGEKVSYPQGNFAQLLAEQKASDGSFVYPRRLADGANAPDAISLLRKTLVAQPDDSVVMLQVGHSANFAKLLDSEPDNISDLNGHDLIKKKVSKLVVMAGRFQEIRWEDNVIPAGYPDANLQVDVPLAQKLFSEWPVPIIASGTELASIIFPVASIKHDFSYIGNHPIAESYRNFVFEVEAELNGKQIKVTSGWPNDTHTADLNAALYAAVPEKNYYSLSKPGKITVLSNGGSRFDESENGKHYYLTVNEEQKIRAQEAMIMLVSQPPASEK